MKFNFAIMHIFKTASRGLIEIASIHEGNNAMPEAIIRNLPWNAPSTWIAFVASVFFLGLGARAIIQPIGASAFFGVAVEGGPGLAFVQAYGARNIGIALTALCLIYFDHRSGLAGLLLAASLIAAIDAYAVGTASGTMAAIKHVIYTFALGAFGTYMSLNR